MSQSKDAAAQQTKSQSKKIGIAVAIVVVVIAVICAIVFGMKAAICQFMNAVNMTYNTA